MPRERVVLCMKWGTVFPADYVNVLFSAVSEHLSPGFRFICMTDDAMGLAPGIVTIPIPDIGLTSAQIAAPGVWRKLALFHPAVANLSPGARALFIDLDMMIVGPLDPFFEAGSGIILLDTGHDWRKRAPVQPSTGVFAFTLGESNSKSCRPSIPKQRERWPGFATSKTSSPPMAKAFPFGHQVRSSASSGIWSGASALILLRARESPRLARPFLPSMAIRVRQICCAGASGAAFRTSGGGRSPGCRTIGSDMGEISLILRPPWYGKQSAMLEKTSIQVLTTILHLYRPSSALYQISNIAQKEKV